MAKKTVAVLGATGTVGQKIIRMLDGHPKFEITQLMASERSQRQIYSDVVRWRESTPIPSSIASMKLISADSITTDYALSSLPAEIAKGLEPELAERGIHIVSNASAHRMGKTIPLVIPEINRAHLSLLAEQKTKGKIITNPNCSTVFLALALAPLRDLGTFEHISVVTLQALSGAGYPGVSSNDILGNIIPYIGNEEDKIEEEPKKILGDAGKALDFPITVNVNRVPVQHGHTITMHIEFNQSITPEQVRQKYCDWNQTYPGLYEVFSQNDRPQPLYDIHDTDQRCLIGRIKQGAKPNIISLISQGHNLVRGAAGAAILNLETLNHYLEQ